MPPRLNSPELELNWQFNSVQFGDGGGLKRLRTEDVLRYQPTVGSTSKPCVVTT